MSGDELTNAGSQRQSTTSTLHDNGKENEQEKSIALKSDAKQRQNIPPDDDHDDTLIVDWDGPDDVMNPKNWSYGKKWAATIVISSFTFMSPVSSSMIAPASQQLASDLGITDPVRIAMSVSIFVLAYAIGPLFIGPLSEVYGRAHVLQLANMFYLAWNLACGFAQSETQLIVFRFLAGLGGSAPLSIGGGVLGDCWPTEQRGRAIAIYSLAPLLGPVIGPVAGAWIAEKSTWRWVFWSTTILGAVIQLFGFFFLQETYAPVLLERKAAKIRRDTSTNNGSNSKSHDLEKGSVEQRDGMGTEKMRKRHVRTVFEGEDRHWRKIIGTALTRPFAMFFTEPIIQLLGLYMAFIYGTLYLFLTTIPSIFQVTYHQSPGIAGLHYLALGVGLSGASQVNARMLDKVYGWFKDRNGGVGKPEFRLPSMVPGTVLLPAGVLITGWSAQYKVHWIVPDIGIALVGAGLILNFQSIQTYVIDSFTLYAASALAAVTFLRSCAGFGFPLFAPAMYKALGYGKGDTVLAVAAIVIGCPAPWLFWVYGERIRHSSKYGKKGP